MSYLAIARKYRPVSFSEIVGQQHVTRTLENALKTGRIHHAFLFCGARGVGKTTAARALAKALNCEHGPTPTPCGECTSCVQMAAGNHPDLVEIDGASNNGVDHMRDLRETVAYAPQTRYRIYLIDEVHMLTNQAFNALLKTLEEPPPHVVFLFATTEPNKILDTILSRVQRFDFKRIPVPVVAERLGKIASAEGLELSEHALRVIARAGEGSMRDAESLLDKVVSFKPADQTQLSDAMVAETLGLIDRNLVLDTLNGLVVGEPARCLEAIAKVYGFGHDLSHFSQDLLEVLRNATLLRLGGDAAAHVDVSEDERKRIEQIVAGVSAGSLNRTFQALLDVHDQVSRARRPRIVLDMAVARLATVRQTWPLPKVLARLEELERRLRAHGAAAPVVGLRGRASPKRVMIKAQPVATPPPRKIQNKAPKKANHSSPASAQTKPRSAGSPALNGASQAQLRSGFLRFEKELQAIGDHTRFLSVQPEVKDDRLVFFITGGLNLARAQRVLSLDEVQGVLRRCFPKMRCEARLKPGTGSPKAQQRALKEEVGRSELGLIIKDKLEGVLESVISLKEQDDTSLS